MVSIFSPNIRPTVHANKLMALFGSGKCMGGTNLRLQIVARFVPSTCHMYIQEGHGIETMLF